MKQVKVAFLFFYIIYFGACKNKVVKIEHKKRINSQVRILLNSQLYKKSRYEERLILLKNTINDTLLDDYDNFLVSNNLSFLYAKLNNIDSAIHFSKKMLEQNNLDGYAYYKLGNYYCLKNLKDSAYYYYKKAEKNYLKNNDSMRLAECLRNLSIIESDFGNYVDSDISGIKALTFFNGKREKSIISVYNCLAINSKEQQLYKEAIYYFNKSLLFKLTEHQKIGINNNIANVYKEQKEYTKAILILEKLLKKTITNKKTKARIIDNLAHCKWLNNAKENILDSLLLAVSIRKKEKDTRGLIASYSHLSDYYYNISKSKSLEYASKMYQFSKKIKSIADVIEAIDKLVKLTPQKKAIKLYKEGIRLRDSLQNTKIQIEHQFAKIKYNYEEEEKQKIKFKTLATENRLIAAEEKNKKKNGFIAAILVTVALLFYGYRRKQQYKKKIVKETYDTETRIAKKLHDELGNDLYNTITKIQNSKFKKEEIVDTLDKIYLQTRAISHENDSVEVGDKFENYFSNLLVGYNSNTCKIITKGISNLQLNNLIPEKQIVVYRVFNELLVNMKKHSNASLVVISCKKTKNTIEMIFIDNGIGGKNDSIVLKNGLKNMETRIKTIKGTIKFEQKIDKGFKATVRFKK